MNLVQIGFLSLTLLALADGFLVAPGGGFGGITGILGILLLLLFIAALAENTQGTNGVIAADCPANYTHTPNDPTSCIRFFSSPTKDFYDANTACVSDGAYLLQLNTATFPFILELARNNGGTCSYWVAASGEPVDGVWVAVNGDPIPDTPGIFFSDPTNGNTNDCGLMSNAASFFLLGETCTELHCYICQKDI